MKVETIRFEVWDGGRILAEIYPGAAPRGWPARELLEEAAAAAAAYCAQLNFNRRRRNDVPLATVVQVTTPAQRAA